MVTTLPTYLQHLKENNQVLVKDIERLGKTYLISESDVNRVRRLQADISALNTTIEELTNDESEVSEAYSVLQERLESLQSTLKDIEDDQIGVSERLVQIEKDDINARQKANVYVKPSAYD